MAVDSKAFQHPLFDSGSFTAGVVDVTETLGYSPSLVIVWAPDGTNIDVNVATSAITLHSMLLTGSTGVTTEVLVATGLDITTTGFIVRSERLTDTEITYWVAFR